MPRPFFASSLGERGAGRLPFTSFYRLERDSGGELDLAGVAWEVFIPFCKCRVSWRQVVGLSRVAERADSVHSASCELRMVKGVVQVATKLDFVVLSEGDSFRDADIEVIDTRHLQNVTARGCVHTTESTNVIRIRIVRKIANSLGRSASDRCQSGDAAAERLVAVQVQNHAIAGRVAV